MKKFDGVKKFFGKASCNIGIHKWDKWTYLSETSCDQKAICSRCKKEGHRTRHEWGNWIYINNSSCEQILKCSHCGECQSKMVHNWSAWTYTPYDNNNCKKERVCLRCRKVESELVHHSWSSWQEHANGDLRICRNCGYKQVYYEHDWGSWREYKDLRNEYQNPLEEALSGGDKRKCRRCGTEEKIPKHAWTEWTSLFSDKEGFKCARCGKKVTLDY